MLETDLQHGVRRGRFLRSERIARRYEKGDKSCPNDRKRFPRAWSASAGCTRIGKLEEVSNVV